MKNIKQIKMKKCLKLSDIAEQLDIPLDVVDWTWGKYAHKEISEGIDFDTCGKDYIVYLSGAIWLTKRLNINFRKTTELIEKLVRTGNEEERLTNVLKKVCYLETVIDGIKADLNDDDDRPKHDSNVDEIIFGSKQASQTSKTKYKSNSKFLPELTPEEKMWAEEMHKLLEDASVALSKNPMHVMRKVYVVMRNNYGIVFEQEKREFFSRTGIEETPEITTFRLITYSESLRSLYRSILMNISNYFE